MTPHRLFPTVDLAALEREAAREIAHRRRFYPGRVAAGNMTQAEADRQLALAEAWRADIARITRCWTRSAAERAQAGEAGSALEAPAHRFTWRDRVQALRRELGLRRRFYPDWIKSGRLTEAQAESQRGALECLLAIYDDGLDWRASNGERPHFHLVEGVTPEIAQAREEWAAHCAAIDTERRAQQQELELA